MKPLLKISKLILLLALLALSAPSASAFYDPTLGRWINRDPIVEKGGVNLYRFANNGPTVNTDPYGLCFAVDRNCDENEDAICAFVCAPRGVAACTITETFCEGLLVSSDNSCKCDNSPPPSPPIRNI